MGWEEPENINLRQTHLHLVPLSQLLAPCSKSGGEKGTSAGRMEESGVK